MKPLLIAKLIVGEWMVDSQRKWQWAGFVGGCAVLGFGLAGAFPAAGQEPNGAQTNNPAAAEVLARISEMVQSADSGQPEEVASPEEQTATNGLSQANGLAQAGGPPTSSNRFLNPNRTQNDDRRSRNRRSRSRSGQSGGSGRASDYSEGGGRPQPDSATGTNRLDYANFKVIVDRNIFDPNRFARGPGRGPRPAPKIVDALTLKGTMTYEKGTFAFFVETGSDYKERGLKLNDVIAGHKVANITPDSVILAAGTNQVELKVGMQLRREEDGPWELAGLAGSYAPSSTSTSTNALASTGSDGAASAADSDIIKKLMQRRNSE
jgi:hypothetical protein